MSVALLEKVNNNLLRAVQFHRLQADIFHFLALSGFNALHEYRYLCESLKQRELKRFIVSTCHELLSEEHIEPNITPFSKNRLGVTSNENWQCVKKCFMDYRAWESSSVALYEEIASTLSSDGDVISYDYIKELCLETHAELRHLTDMILAYNAVDWSLEQVLHDNDTLTERYRFLISKLHSPYLGHHMNSDVSDSKKGLYYVHNTSIVD